MNERCFIMKESIKKLLSALLTLIFMLSIFHIICTSSVLPAVNANPWDELYEGPYRYSYELDENDREIKTAVVLWGIDPAKTKDPAIPSHIKGIPVVRLGNGIYSGWKNVTSVTIPETVNSFMGVFEWKNSDPEFDFNGTITNITIRNPLAECSHYDFAGTKWYADQKGPVYLDNIFLGFKDGCDELNKKEYTVEDGTVNIASFTFNNCGDIVKVDLPNSIKIISDFAFDGNNIKEIDYHGTEAQWKQISASKYSRDGIKQPQQYAYMLIRQKNIKVNFLGENSGLPDANAERALGDVDGNGKLESADARLALRASVRLEKYEKGSAQFTAADVDGSGVIESSDARLILRASVKLEDPAKWGK